MTPLHFACQIGSFEITELLINHGADIHAKANINKNFHSISTNYYILFKTIIIFCLKSLMNIITLSFI
jgi:ankyrin repeat protein